jgi:hypothetical protein
LVPPSLPRFERATTAAVAPNGLTQRFAVADVITREPKHPRRRAFVHIQRGTGTIDKSDDGSMDRALVPPCVLQQDWVQRNGRGIRKLSVIAQDRSPVFDVDLLCHKHPQIAIEGVTFARDNSGPVSGPGRLVSLESIGPQFDSEMTHQKLS